MKKGNVNSHLKTLTDNLNNRILPLTKQTLNQLQLKYPKGKAANPTSRYTRANPSG